MYEVYRHHDTVRVGLINGILNNTGIETFLKNWAGSNITEIPIPAIYPAICVLKEEDVKRAMQLISEFHETKEASDPTWICRFCGETVDGYLTECWSCQKLRIESP